MNHSQFLTNTPEPFVPAGISWRDDRKDASLLFPNFQEILLPPTSGSTFVSNSTKQITFRIEAPDSDWLLDGRSLAFRFKATAALGAGGTWGYFNDGIASIIQQVDVKFGGMQAPRINGYNLIANAMTYHTASAAYMQKQGWNAGFYLDYLSSVSNYTGSAGLAAALNSAQSSNGATPPVYTPIQLAEMPGAGAPADAIPALSTAAVADIGANTVLVREKNDPLLDIKTAFSSAAGKYYTVPLSLVSIARSQRLIPLSCFGMIELTLYLEDAATCCLYNGAPPVYTLSDCQLIYKIVRTAPDIAKTIANMSKHNEVGMSMIFDSFDLTKWTNTLTSSMNVPVSISKSKVKSLFTVFRDQAHIANGSYQSLSQFEPLELKWYQWKANGMPVSSYRIGETQYAPSAYMNASELSSQLDKALGVWNSIDTYGVVSAVNYIKYETKNDVELPPRFMIGQDMETLAGVGMTGANLKTGSSQAFLSFELVQMPANLAYEIDVIYQYEFAVHVASSGVSIAD